MSSATASPADLQKAFETALGLVGSLDAAPVVPRILEHTCQAVDASRATLLRVEDDGVLMEGAHDVDGRPVRWEWRGVVADQPLLCEAKRAGHLMIADTPMRPDRLPHELQEILRDVRHTIILPLSVVDSATGFMVVMRRHSRPFLHEDSVTVRLLGNLALLGLRNARLYTDAQAASAAMSSFLNLIVHDLRAPLTVLSGYVDLLRHGTFGETPPEWRKPMQLIASKLSETHRLVDDILLAARLESGAVPATIQRLDLNDVIVRAAERSEARAALAGARIEAVAHGGPVFACGDPFHVDRIIDNLINNAISYGGAAPWIRLSLDPCDPPAVRVEDGGVGISPELHNRIFDRFFRVDHKVPGTGFGLHVGRVLAEACGGSLCVERSALGEGSVFRLELPGAGGSDRSIRREPAA